MRDGVAPKAFLLSGFLWFPIPIAAGFIALSAGSLGIHVVDPNTVGPQVASAVLGRSGTMLVFIVVFCSLASSIDSLLAATSDLLVEDIYKKMLGKTAGDLQLRRAAQGVVLLLGGITWIICLAEFNLLEVLFLSGPLVASAIWPVVAGLYGKNTNPAGASAAMILGSSAGLFAYHHPSLGWYTASLVSVAVSMLVVFISTALAPRPFDWNKLSHT